MNTLLGGRAKHIISVCGLLLFLTAPAQAVITDLSVLPPNPNPGTEVTVLVEGGFPDLCWSLTSQSMSQSGNIITVDLVGTDIALPENSCNQAWVPYAVAPELGFLPAGTYAVIVIEHRVSARDPGTSSQHMTFAVGGSGFACDCACNSDFGCNGASDVTDVIRAINLAFRGSQPTQLARCPWGEMDVNCSGVTDIVDVIAVVNVAFRGATAATTFCAACSP